MTFIISAVDNCIIEHMVLFLKKYIKITGSVAEFEPAPLGNPPSALTTTPYILIKPQNSNTLITTVF